MSAIKMNIRAEKQAVAHCAAILVPAFPSLHCVALAGDGVQFVVISQCRAGSEPGTSESYAQAHCRVHDTLIAKLPKKLHKLVSSYSSPYSAE